MRTVDILAAATALLADKTNWGTGNLVDFNRMTNKSCFCAMGAILKEGGVLQPTNLACGKRFAPADECWVGNITGLAAVKVDGFYTYALNIHSLGRSVLSQFEGRGVYLTQTMNAMRYLREAVNQMLARNNSGPRDIWSVNDGADGYNIIMEALRIATRNAKRRHITGDRKKAVA